MSAGARESVWEDADAEPCAVILAPFGQDSALIGESLAEAGIRAIPVGDLSALTAMLPRCRVALLATEAIEPDGLACLQRRLAEQPAWSDAQIILLTGALDPQGYSALARALGNATIIQRPVASSSLVTVVETALRARRRQYEVRDLLRASERQQAHIEALNEHLQRAMAETHHRVKNNLQVISSMADMSLMIGNGTVSAGDLQRIGMLTRTLAALHDILTHAVRERAAADALSTDALLDKLVPMLRDMAPGHTITARYDRVRLTTRQGTSLAIVVNELVANAVKHGGEEVSVVFSNGEAEASLVVSDNGPGFRPDFDVKSAANTGLALVDQLSRWDLGGSARYENNAEGGARVTVSIPVAAPAL